MKAKIIATVVGILVLVGTTAAFACPGGKGHHGKRGHGKGGGMHGLMEKLDLTDAQKAEMEKLHTEMKEDVEPLRERMKELKQQMHQLWENDPVDEEALITLEREMATMKLQMSELRIQMKVDMMDILTPEQRAKFQELKKEFKGKHGKRGKGKGCSGECGGDCPHRSADQ